MPETRCPMPDARYQMPDIRCQIARLDRGPVFRRVTGNGKRVTGNTPRNAEKPRVSLGRSLHPPGASRSKHTLRDAPVLRLGTNPCAKAGPATAAALSPAATLPCGSGVGNRLRELPPFGLPGSPRVTTGNIRQAPHRGNRKRLSDFACHQKISRRLASAGAAVPSLLPSCPHSSPGTSSSPGW